MVRIAKKQTCVAYLLVDGLATKQKLEIIEERNIEKLKIPNKCIAFYFFNCRVKKAYRKNEYGPKQNVSGKYFLGGEILDVEQISQNPKLSFMLKTMEEQDLKVIKTPAEKYQFFDEKIDTILNCLF